MSDSDDLRSRIEAQIAARRGGTTGRHARGDDSAPAAVSTAEAPVSPLGVTQVIDAIPPREPTQTRPRHAARSHARRPPPHRFGVAFRMAVLVAVAGVLALCLRSFVIEPFWIPSESMEPTLHGCAGCNDDRLLVDKLSYKLHSVHRGDVVVFHRPPSVDAAENVLIKRVIALGGETVSGHDGRVWIGNRPLVEPYVNSLCDGTGDFTARTVPRGEVFVMGDNRCDSTDSRIFGPISTSSIIGRAFVIIWPLGRIHWL